MKYFVSAGELSGDMHLSLVVREIKKQNNNAEFVGMGGRHLEKEGVKLLENIENTAVMGFLEILGKYNYLKKKAESFVEYIIKEKIKNVILIDYGGFNLYLLELIKKVDYSIKVFYYIPPKLWVWGEKRIKKLKQADFIMVIFPWEKEFYNKHGVDACYFGNPLVDLHSQTEQKGDKILLLPGSRNQEISALIPEMVKVAKTLKDKKFILKPAENEKMEKFKELLKSAPNIEVISDKETLKTAAEMTYCAIAASGTVILETALLGLPTVVVYKVSIISEIIARFIIKIKYLSLPNIILKREFFPELLQKDCRSENIVREVSKMENSKQFKDGFKEIRDILGGKDIVEKYGDFVNKNSNK